MASVFIGGYCKVADYGALLSQKLPYENRAVFCRGITSAPLPAILLAMASVKVIQSELTINLASIYGKSYIRFPVYICDYHMFTPDLICKALSDSTRARIALLVAREKELCVCELTCALDEIQPKISRHLALLRESGVLADRRQGQWIYYRLHPDLPEWVIQMMQTMLAANTEWLEENHQRLCAMQDRPNRCC